MIYDYIIMNKVKEELKKEVEGGNITKIFQTSPLNLIISVKQERKVDIFISIDPQNPRVYITGKRMEETKIPYNFSLLLKKYIMNGRITDITMPPMERIIIFHIRSRSETGELLDMELIAEIMGRHSNIILLSKKDNIIQGCSKHVTSKVNRHREILEGERYIPPPSDNKRNPCEINEEDFNNIMSGDDKEALFIKNFGGTGVLWAKEILKRAEGSNLYNVWTESWKELLTAGDSILYYNKEDKKPLFPLPLAYPVELSLLKDFPWKKFSSVSQALNEGFYIWEKEKNIKENKTLLTKESREYRKKQFQLKEKLAKQLEKSEKAMEYKKKGDIILANLHIKPGDNKILKLTDIYDEEQKEIEIEINPDIPLSQNGQKYFEKYKKAQRSRESSEKQMKEAEMEIEYIENVIQSIEMSEDIKELSEIKDELVENDIIKEKKIQKKKKKEDDIPSFIHIVHDGWDIFIGKNNKQNDLLTMKMAKGNDVWIHAKNIPGSHVIIRNPKGLEISAIPYKILLKGAELASYYSKSRNSSQVIVDYTLRKYVKKPKGAKPGMVIYYGEKSINVNRET